MTVWNIIMAVLLVIFLWLYIDFTWGRKSHLKKLERTVCPIRQSDMELFANGPALFDDLFSELKKAQKHIHVLFYIVKEDKISKEFLTILMGKAKEGVEVRLLLDWAGSFTIKRKTVKKLKSSGIKFSFAHVPKLPFLFYSFHARNHRKIAVIDGKIGYTGGFNIGKEYINEDKKLTPWRDYHLKFKGEGVQDLQREFLTDWYKATKTDLLANSVYFPDLHAGLYRQQFSAYKGAFLEETFSSLIRNAKTGITIGTPYFIPSKRLYKDLLHALERGVTVKLLVPSLIDHILVKEASYHYLRALIREGAYVYEYKKGFYHAKAIMIDDDICDIGTANFDKRSLFLNYEINCFIYDKEFIKEIKAVLDKDILDAKRLTLKELNRPDPLRTFKEMLARSVASFL
ncbi:MULTISPECIES: cardiolipin synthase [Cytobacillus]|uniref:cardiolipin synthase n=1 Tax=Cytobacillus TaxID=2675230 RepID=UPI00203A3E55|nr:cardiolipin synthase [Cytobacillus firmus]MCM3705431.1 cardiolipin synthase [Cytobacillus firmus]